MMYSTQDITNIISNMKCKLAAQTANIINRESMGIFDSWYSSIYIQEAMIYLQKYLDDELCSLEDTDIIKIINKLNCL